MKIILLLIGFFFFVDMHGSDDVFSRENLLSKVTHEKFMVLHSLNAHVASHSLKLNFKIKNLRPLTSVLRENVFSKVHVYFKFIVVSKQSFDWGPQNLPTPPPFIS